MRNLKLTIEYNGSKFSGWQKQTGKRTIQGELEEAFFRLTGENVCIEGSGRTDKGVHAMAQIASVQTESKIPLKNFKYALNNQLPSDIRIKKIEIAQKDFHARFSSKKKTYRYVVHFGKDKPAISNEMVGFYRNDIDVERLQQAIPLFVGKHNFKAFCSANTQVTNFEREVFDLTFSKRGSNGVFEITGNGFLYNMVRIIVGTLLDYASGKLDLENIEKAFETGERKYAGTTMEPNGLYLKKVVY